MIKIKRTEAGNKDFLDLVNQLNDELKERDGDEYSFFSQFNKVDTTFHVVVAYEDGKAAGCGAIKPFDEETTELKRMYTSRESRRKGVASKILSELEEWAGELKYKACILETGNRQREAIKMYMKNGYRKIPNYGQYKGITSSVCFKKKI